MIMDPRHVFLRGKDLPGMKLRTFCHIVLTQVSVNLCLGSHVEVWGELVS